MWRGVGGGGGGAGDADPTRTWVWKDWWIGLIFTICPSVCLSAFAQNSEFDQGQRQPPMEIIENDSDHYSIY